MSHAVTGARQKEAARHSEGSSCRGDAEGQVNSAPPVHGRIMLVPIYGLILNHMRTFALCTLQRFHVHSTDSQRQQVHVRCSLLDTVAWGHHKAPLRSL